MAGTYIYTITNPFYGVDLTGLGLATAAEPGLGLASAQNPGLASAQKPGLGPKPKPGSAPGPRLAPINADAPMLLIQTTTVNNTGVTISEVVDRGKGLYYSMGEHQMKCVFVPAPETIYAKGSGDGGDGRVEITVSLTVTPKKTVVKWGHPPPHLQRGMGPYLIICYLSYLHLS